MTRSDKSANILIRLVVEHLAFTPASNNFLQADSQAKESCFPES